MCKQLTYRTSLNINRTFLAAEKYQKWGVRLIFRANIFWSQFDNLGIFFWGIKHGCIVPQKIRYRLKV